jgi:hypothetical protein
MAQALEQVMHPANASEIGAWVEHLAGSELAGRADRVTDIESRSDIHEGLVSMAAALSSPGSSGNLGGAPISRPRASTPDLTPSGMNGGTSANYAASPSPSTPDLSSRSSQIVQYPPQNNQRTKWIVLAIAVGAFAVLAVGILLGAATRSSTTTPAPASEAVQDNKPPPSLSAEPPATMQAAPPPSTAPAGSESATAAADSAARPHPTATATHPWVAPHPTAHTPAPPSKNCNPPFTIDASGIRHFKPECG